MYPFYPVNENFSDRLLDRGERIVEILHWLGMSRAGLWYLWQRYLERGVEAIFDAERSGRPAIFSPAGTGSD